MLREACPKTKFQESLGYRSIIVIPTIQKASFGFCLPRNRSRSPKFQEKKIMTMQNHGPVWENLIFTPHTHTFLHRMQIKSPKSKVTNLPVRIWRLCELLLTLKVHPVSATETAGSNLTERPQKKAWQYSLSHSTYWSVWNPASPKEPRRTKRFRLKLELGLKTTNHWRV